MITTKVVLDKQTKRGSVKVRIGKDRQAAYISLPIEIDPKQWKDGRVVNHPAADYYNALISTEKSKIDKYLFVQLYMI